MTDALVTQAHIDWAERALPAAPLVTGLIPRVRAVEQTAQALANMEAYARSASEREIRALEEELQAVKRQARIAELRAWNEGAIFVWEERRRALRKGRSAPCHERGTICPKRKRGKLIKSATEFETPNQNRTPTMTYPKCLPPEADAEVTRDHRCTAAAVICDNWRDAPLQAWVETGDPAHLEGQAAPAAELPGLAMAFATSEESAKYDGWLEGFDARGEGVDRDLNPYRDPFDPTLMIYRNEDATYVAARSCEDAALVYSEHLGNKSTSEFSLVPGDQVISIRCRKTQEGHIEPAKDDADQPNIETFNMRASTWVQTFNNREFLCTTRSEKG